MPEDAGWVGIYWADIANPQPYLRGECIFIVENNSNGPIIHWISAPEPVIVAAVNNTTKSVARSMDGKVWTGQEVLNMIFNCKIRNYEQIQV